ncbi:hypothetical protein EYF80_029099 [Liparis tanakae]|uniref:Uncharacterized protein n=1 Tax=Liparis tanakae TaxID=230148 RepID=A0A4Z2H498_9TELE|nr:hypothetical protein EYF80_029099 [Liparis tanakae]
MPTREKETGHDKRRKREDSQFTIRCHKEKHRDPHIGEAQKLTGSSPVLQSEPIQPSRHTWAPEGSQR